MLVCWGPLCVRVCVCVCGGGVMRKTLNEVLWGV